TWMRPAMLSVQVSTNRPAPWNSIERPWPPHARVNTRPSNAIVKMFRAPTSSPSTSSRIFVRGDCMYGDDPRDFGLGPEGVEEPRDARAKSDEEDATDTNRPRTLLYNEGFNEE